jgi:hypothetical protein
VCSPGICGHDWCYLCAGAWQRDPDGFPRFCEHAPECPEADGMQGAFDEPDPEHARREFLPPMVADRVLPEDAWEDVSRLAAEAVRDGLWRV